MTPHLDTASQPELAPPLSHALNAMENAQLVRRSDEGDLDYLFKHALVQETVYSAMMRHDRRRLHRLVGEALERAFPDRAVEFAPRLAVHFEEAGDMERALHYYERAAQDADAHYANREALAFYTGALEAAQALQTDTLDTLHRARGLVHERIGEFDAARADLETAFEIARGEGDALAEWQSLLDLGFVWLARDYARAGEYFERALELARASNDSLRVAYTLNRAGNWYLNNEDPQRALAYHREALSIFESLGDAHGLAETEDLLAMSSRLGSDLFAASEHYRTAVSLFEKLGDSRGVANSLTSNILYGPSLQAETTVFPPPIADISTSLERILRLTNEVGWRAGEAYCLWVFGESFAAMGEYGRGLELVHRSLVIAREIDHRQWLAAATMVLGAIHARILDSATAQATLEKALALAHEIGSTHWIRTASGLLASAYISQKELTRAARVLDAALPPNTPARTWGQRQVWVARVELALARQDPGTALEWLDLLLREAFNLTPGAVIPRLWLHRAQALILQQKFQEAELLLVEASTTAAQTRERPLLWRIFMVLGQVYRAQGRAGDAASQFDRAEQLVGELAMTIDDQALRENFVTRAQAMIRGG